MASYQIEIIETVVFPDSNQFKELKKKLNLKILSKPQICLDHFL